MLIAFHVVMIIIITISSLSQYTRRNSVLQPAARLQTLSCQIRPCGQKNMKNYDFFETIFFSKRLLLCKIFITFVVTYILLCTSVLSTYSYKCSMYCAAVPECPDFRILITQFTIILYICISIIKYRWILFYFI